MAHGLMGCSLCAHMEGSRKSLLGPAGSWRYKTARKFPQIADAPYKFEPVDQTFRFLYHLIAFWGLLGSDAYVRTQRNLIY